jgi:hypothetical protein
LPQVLTLHLSATPPHQPPVLLLLLPLLLLFLLLRLWKQLVAAEVSGRAACWIADVQAACLSHCQGGPVVTGVTAACCCCRPLLLLLQPPLQMLRQPAAAMKWEAL